MVGFPTSYLLDFAKGLAREPFPVSLDVDHPLASLARALRGGAARETPAAPATALAAALRPWAA